MEALPIETERLLLRQFAVEDAEDVFAIFSDEQTTLDCGGYHAFDAMDDEYRRLMQKFAGQMRYSIVEKETGRVVGVISMMDAERAVPGWELGIEIAPDARPERLCAGGAGGSGRSLFCPNRDRAVHGWTLCLQHRLRRTAEKAGLCLRRRRAQGDAPRRTRADRSCVLLSGKRIRLPSAAPAKEAADFFCKALASGPAVRYA